MAFKLPNYPTYDTSNGFGSAREWRGAFRERMGVEEAEEYFADQARAGRKQTPYEILGVSVTALWSAVKSAYRRLCRDCAPDYVQGRGGSQAELDAATERMKAINAAYTIVERDYERAGRKH